MPWRILGIEPTRDEREIRRAYARALKTRQHESDPGFFGRLRQAYDLALGWARSGTEAWEIGGDALENVSPKSAVEQADVLSGDPVEEDPVEENSEAVPHAPPVSVESPRYDRYSYSYTYAVDGETDKPETGSGDDLIQILQLIENVFAECGDFTPAKKGRKKLLSLWEDLRGRLDSENLAVRENFAERMAILLARHWPASNVIWRQVREYFHWVSAFGGGNSEYVNALRVSFCEEEKNDFSGRPKNLVRRREFLTRRRVWLLFLFMTFVMLNAMRHPSAPSTRYPSVSPDSELLFRLHTQKMDDWLQCLRNCHSRPDSALNICLNKNSCESVAEKNCEKLKCEKVHADACNEECPFPHP